MTHSKDCELVSLHNHRKEKSCVCTCKAHDEKEGWEEALQVEIMEPYLFTAEMLHKAKDQKSSMDDMRKHWEALKDFVSTEIAKARESERERVREWAREIQKDFIWDNGSCSICGQYSYDGEAHHCESYNQALQDLLTFLQDKKETV